MRDGMSTELPIRALFHGAMYAECVIVRPCNSKMFDADKLRIRFHHSEEIYMARMRFIAVAVVTGFILAACGGSEKSKVEKVINEGLSKAPQCTKVPIGIPIDKSKVGDDGAIGQLKAKGLIAEGKVKEERAFGGAVERDGYVFTDQAKNLIQHAGSTGWIPVAPCVRTGKFAIADIEAIDYGSAADGRPVANARAKIKFVPEAWLADTRGTPAWEKFWVSVAETEKSQWLYQLLKSGDEFYFTGPGQRLK